LVIFDEQDVRVHGGILGFGTKIGLRAIAAAALCESSAC
jgi:hypothetical protein